MWPSTGSGEPNHRRSVIATRAVLFDLDGTLIDSFPGIASAYHHLLTQLDLGDLDDASIKAFVGPPIQEVLHDRFGLSGDRLREGVDTFRAHYGSEGLYRFTTYAGIDDMLLAVRDAGYEMAIATSKLTSMARDVVAAAGWSDLFTTIGGALPDGTRHLKVDVIEWTLAQLTPGLPVAAMVGDRGTDISSGRTVGLTGIGVSWGYGHVDELTAAGAAIIVESPDAVLLSLEQLSHRPASRHFSPDGCGTV
jgi:phosphoglycolate phosphatase